MPENLPIGAGLAAAEQRTESERQDVAAGMASGVADARVSQGVKPGG